MCSHKLSHMVNGRNYYFSSVNGKLNKWCSHSNVVKNHVIAPVSFHTVVKHEVLWKEHACFMFPKMFIEENHATYNTQALRV